MSDTVQLPTDPAPLPLPPIVTTTSTASTVAGWGAPVISVYALTLMLAALAVAYYMKNETLLVALCTAIATNFTTVVSFWIGSSHGSQKKDEVNAALLTQGQTRTATTT